MLDHANNVEKGAKNLLIQCAGTKAGDRLLVIHEPPGLGYYDEEIVKAIVDCGRKIGADVTVEEVPFNPNATRVPAPVAASMSECYQVVFLARLGDQLRFSDLPQGMRSVVSYALDVKMLASGFGTATYQAFEELKVAVNQMVASADNVHVTCPKGTDYVGRNKVSPDNAVDVGIFRFPMSVFTPVPASDFSGRVATPGFLVGTGSMYYENYAKDLPGPLIVLFENGRITGFEGAPETVQIAEQHYQYVADKFDIDRDFIHSWHAGIHPGCNFAEPASDNWERWSGGAFGNPRLLHFHTCGAYAPGEISLNVVDPTIEVDGIAVWKNGVFQPQHIPGGGEILARFDDARILFDNPSRQIGL